MNDTKLKKILYIGVVALCVIFAFALFIQNNNKRSTSISITSLKDSTSQSAQRIDDVLDRAQQELHLTSELYEEMLQSPDVTAQDLQTLTDKSPFNYIAFVDQSGTDLNAQGKSSDVSDTTYYKDGIAGNSGIDVVFNLDSDEENLIVFYTPLYYNESIIGVLLGLYRESDVEDIIYSSFFGEDARTFLCTRDGTVIACCNEDTSTNSVFAAKAFLHPLSDTVTSELKEALENGEEYEFQYKGTSGTGNAYVTELQNSEWMLIQTFPSQVTSRFVNSANKAGVQLLIELVCIFLACLIIVLVSNTVQKRRLVLENTEKSYVVDGILQLFGAFVLVDLKENTYRYLAGSTPRVDEIATEGAYDDFVTYLLNLINDEDTRTHFEALLVTTVLQQNMDIDNPALRYECPVKVGNGKWESINLICLEREDGVATEILFTYQDVTTVKERELRSYEALKEAYRAVESANHAKSTFLSNMSHDIRTPMNAIMGMTAIAAMNMDNPARIKDCLNKITVSSQHLLGLINEVLDMSKIESGKVILTEEEFALSTVVDSVVTIFLSQTKANGQDFKVNASDITHEDVIGDCMRLQQIFVNILGNAVKFTPEGGTITFSIAERPSDIHGCGCYVFTFEDTGIGMEESFLAQIFEPFARANNSNTERIEGTGLGMPIVKNIVHMMNGDIQVESKLGEGSKFTVTLYLQLNHTKEEELQDLQNLPVLVADDDQDACESACLVLSDIGMAADWVLSGDEAIVRLVDAHNEHSDYAAVILDWKMPDKDGIQTAREIRAKLGDDVPIIILSAFDYSDIEQEARDAGVNAFICKPLFKSRLVYVMKSVMRGKEPESSDENTEIDNLQNHDYSGRRVLLVEDNELNMEIAKELLTQVGLTVDEAVNGQLALERVCEMPANYYDLVFMDIQMPEMNGYEATAAIRAQSREDLKTLPIVAMTADAFTDDVLHAKQAGMNDHIAKPVEIKKLVKALEKWI